MVAPCLASQGVASRAWVSDVCARVGQDYYNDNPEADNIRKLRDQVGEVREIMVENIGASLLLLLLRWPRACARLCLCVRVCICRSACV